jgi:hypothetical protein
MHFFAPRKQLQLHSLDMNTLVERASGGVVSTLDSNAGEPGSSPGGGKDIFSRMRRPITWAGDAHVVRMGR